MVDPSLNPTGDFRARYGTPYPPNQMQGHFSGREQGNMEIQQEINMNIKMKINGRSSAAGQMMHGLAQGVQGMPRMFIRDPGSGISSGTSYTAGVQEISGFGG